MACFGGPYFRAALVTAGLACGCGSTPAADFYSGDPLTTPPPGAGGFAGSFSGSAGASGFAGSFSGSAGASGGGVAGGGGCNESNAVSFPNQALPTNSGPLPDEGGCFRINHPSNGFNTVGCSNWDPSTRTLRCNGMDVPNCNSPSRATYPGPRNGNDYFEVGPGTSSFTKGSIFWYTQ
jgi:hypothetical protein